MAFGAVDEVKRDSPLGPALGNLFMGSNEQKWLKSNQEDLLRKFFRRYIDDIFCLIEHQNLIYLCSLHSQHPDLISR